MISGQKKVGHSIHGNSEKSVGIAKISTALLNQPSTRSSPAVLQTYDFYQVTKSDLFSKQYEKSEL